MARRGHVGSSRATEDSRAGRARQLSAAEDHRHGVLGAPQRPVGPTPVRDLGSHFAPLPGALDGSFQGLTWPSRPAWTVSWMTFFQTQGTTALGREGFMGTVSRLTGVSSLATEVPASTSVRGVSLPG